MTHGLERTSPKGSPFLGTCRYCGKTNLPSRAALDFCESAPSQAQQVLDAIDGPPASRPVAETPTGLISALKNLTEFAADVVMPEDGCKIGVMIYLARDVKRVIALASRHAEGPQADEIELRLSKDELSLLSTVVRFYRMKGPTYIPAVIDVIQEGMDRLMLQTIRGERSSILGPRPAEGQSDPLSKLTRYDLQGCEGEGRQCWAELLESSDGNWVRFSDVLAAAHPAGPATQEK